MSFFKVGDKFGVNQANLLKKIGFGDSSDAGENEVRLFNENGVFVFKTWHNGNWESIQVGGGLPSSGMKEFAPGRYIFQVPQGVEQLKLSGTGAGAGGHSGYKGSAQYAGWGGGSGQWVKDHIIDVIPGEFLPVEVGTGGAGGFFTWSSGKDGGNTFFGHYLLLHGGRYNHSGGNYNGGQLVPGAVGAKGGDSTLIDGINTGAGGGSTVQGTNDESRLSGGAGGDGSIVGTVGGAGGTVSSTYGAGGSGGGAGYGGNGGAGGSCNGVNATKGNAHHPDYDGQNASGYGAGGGGGAAHGRPNYAWGQGGNGGNGYLKIEWS